MEAKNMITRLFSSCFPLVLNILFFDKNKLSEAHKEVLLRGSAAVAKHDEWINVLEWDRNFS